MDKTFLGHQIESRNVIEWSSRFPDLSSLDFILWDYLKNKIYATQAASLENLRQRIVDECREIPPQALEYTSRIFIVWKSMNISNNYAKLHSGTYLDIPCNLLMD